MKFQTGDRAFVSPFSMFSHQRYINGVPAVVIIESVGPFEGFGSQFDYMARLVPFGISLAPDLSDEHHYYYSEEDLISYDEEDDFTKNMTNAGFSHLLETED